MAHALEGLFEKGALDVYQTPIVMKKGRLAVKVSVLVDEKRIEIIKETLFKETSAIGLRMYPVHKVELERSYETLQTAYGQVAVKKAFYEGTCVNKKFEYEDCKKIAKAMNVPLKEAYAWLAEEDNRKDKRHAFDRIEEDT